MGEGVGSKATGKGNCDKKCSGTQKNIKLEGDSGVFTFNIKVTKGVVKITNGRFEAAAAATTTAMPPTGSGSGSPSPYPGSGTGSGSEPGEGMQCSCKCECPAGHGQCDCSCNCPMQSTSDECAAGFTRVCPAVDGACPQDMEEVCPAGVGGGGPGQSRVSGSQEGCQCVADFLLGLVMDPMGTRTRSNT